MFLTIKQKNDYAKKYYIKKIEKYKKYLGGKCMSCGSEDNLEFDHINPNTKEFTITKKPTYSWSVIKKELDKCQLLCRECHYKKTKNNFPVRKHGTWGMIRRGRCKCKICHDFVNKYKREYRKKKSSVV